jgi:hypothetical protein
VFFSLLSALVHLVPAINTFFKDLSDKISETIPLPGWAFHALFIALGVGVIFALLFWTRLGNLLDDLFDRTVRWIFTDLRPTYYEPEERTSAQFKQDIRRALLESQRMYCLLLSAHTLIHEEEQFISDALFGLPANQLTKKDIRVLLLDRNTEVWKKRADLLLKARLENQDIDLAGYVARCKQAENKLRRIGKVEFYTAEPHWRLYIFDHRVFASQYGGPPESETLMEGHLHGVAAFDDIHPMYRWLYKEFRRMAPATWKEELPRDLTE